MKRRARSVFLTMIGAGLAGGFVATAGVAQPVNLGAANSADFKVVYATPQDVIEGRQVAETMCARCHGINGISKEKGVPHIAGQRPVYLHLEMKVYQAGGRGSKDMSNTVKYMNDDAIMKVSAFYASLDPAEPSGGSAKAAPVKPSAISAGKAAAAGCGGCHGEEGISSTPGMPSLIAMDPKYFVAAINAYKGGQRKHDMMKTLVSGLSETDLNNIALYYALEKPGKAKTPAPGNVAAGKTAAAGCVGCHGEGGVSGNPTTPSLAGQDAQYFIDAMRAYKDGSRSDATMKGPAGSIDDATAKNLAAYYAGQPPQAAKVAKPLTVAEWAERCDRCHGVNGNSTDPRSPALAAQRTEYLERVLRAYKKGERKSKEMAVMSEGLDDALVSGLAGHYARQKARGLTYLVLPPPPAAKK
jgi:cytochrome c553